MLAGDIRKITLRGDSRETYLTTLLLQNKLGGVDKSSRTIRPVKETV